MTDLASAPALNLMAAENRQLFRQLGAVPTAAPSHDCIHSAFEEWAVRSPDALAVVHGGEQITYGELDRRANCLASLLRVHGVRAGDRVGLFLRQSVPMVVGILATLKIGAAYVPQDPRSTPPQDLGHIIATARTRVVLTLGQHLGRIPRAKGQALIALDKIALDALRYDGSIPLVTATDLVDTAVVLFTSRPTGRRRGVAWTHAQLCNALLSERGSFGIEPGMRVAQLLNIAFDLAVWEIFGALAHGATLVIRGKVIEETLRNVDVVIATPGVLSCLDPLHCRNVTFLDVPGRRTNHGHSGRRCAS